MAGHVFLSYAREDSAYVEQLRAFLQQRGIPAWVDTETDYGSRWTQVIREQVDTCAALVVVMTPEAESSEWVDREIHRAETLDKVIVPLLLRGQSFFRLGVTQYVDVTDGRLPPDDLVQRLRAAIGAGAATAPLPPPVVTPDQSAVDVELTWPGASGYAADAHVVVELDGTRVVEGSFLEGFGLAARWPVGPHTLTTTTTAMRVVQRKRTYAVDLSAGRAYMIVLRYSRPRGNFTPQLDITSR